MSENIHDVIVIGGAAVTEEFSPGFRASIFSYVMSILHLKVIRDVGKTAEQFARFSKADGAIYPQFDAWLNEAADIVRVLLLEAPVDPARQDWRSRKELFKMLWKHRKIGGKFYRLVDLMTMSADDFLSRWFEHSVTRAVLGYYFSIGTFASPKSPGSA